ncbi:alpha/beta hydrolase [Agrobacterium sp. SORGH_AS_0440]|uniref:alpha/beta hydrolase n=1 Tax=Agrobacterium sp. SORGH_AS_0440 TaxID=3041757 RepID=UPI003857D861
MPRGAVSMTIFRQRNRAGFLPDVRLNAYSHSYGSLACALQQELESELTGDALAGRWLLTCFL